MNMTTMFSSVAVPGQTCQGTHRHLHNVQCTFNIFMANSTGPFQKSNFLGFLSLTDNEEDPTMTGTGFDSCADEDDPSTVSSSWDS